MAKIISAILMSMTALSSSYGRAESDHGTVIAKYRAVMQRKPDSESPQIQIWKIHQTDSLRINLVRIIGELALHKHPDAAHSLMILDGRVQVTVGDKKVWLTKNDFISIPEGVPHKYKSLTASALFVSMDAPCYDPNKTIALE